MSWVEIEALTQQVRQLPVGRQQTNQQLSQVMVSAHSTMMGVLLPTGRIYPLGKEVGVAAPQD